MPGEFDALHKAASIATTYVGRLASQLQRWERNMNTKFDLLVGKKLTTSKEIKPYLDIFVSSVKQLVDNEVKAKAEPGSDDAINHELTFKLFKKKWDEIFIPSIADLKLSPKKFTTVSEAKLAVDDLVLKLKKLENEELKKAVGQDSKPSRIIKIKLKDISFATVSNTLAKVDNEIKGEKK